MKKKLTVENVVDVFNNSKIQIISATAATTKDNIPFVEVVVNVMLFSRDLVTLLLQTELNEWQLRMIIKNDRLVIYLVDIQSLLNVNYTI